MLLLQLFDLMRQGRHPPNWSSYEALSQLPIQSPIYHSSTYLHHLTSNLISIITLWKDVHPINFTALFRSHAYENTPKKYNLK